MSRGVALIANERQRQINEEGYTPAHDEGRVSHLLDAGRAYVQAGHVQYIEGKPLRMPPYWPWASRYWKPGTNPVRVLVKAGALIAAAIDALIAAGYSPDGPKEEQ